MDDLDTRMEKYQGKHRKSVTSISSTDSLNEEDIDEKFKKIVTKFRVNPIKAKRESNTIFCPKNDTGDKKESDINLINTSKTKTEIEKEIILENEKTGKYDELINKEKIGRAHV